MEPLYVSATADDNSTRLVDADLKSLPCMLCPASAMGRFNSVRNLLVSCGISRSLFSKKPNLDPFHRCAFVDQSFWVSSVQPCNALHRPSPARLFPRKTRDCAERTQILLLLCDVGVLGLWHPAEREWWCSGRAVRSRVFIADGEISVWKLGIGLLKFVFISWEFFVEFFRN